MKKNRLLFTYLIFDIFAALCAWFLFLVYRKYGFDPYFYPSFKEVVFFDKNLYLGGAIILPTWILLYTLTGYYSKIFRKSRLQELGTTLSIILLGVLLFFFLFILDDQVQNEDIRQIQLIKYFLFYFSLQFLLTYIPRVIITSRVNKKIQTGQIGFNTLIIGSDELALTTYSNIIKQDKAAAKFILGYISLPEIDNHVLGTHLKHLGSIDQIQEIIEEHQIVELVIAVQNGEEKYIETLLPSLGQYHDLTIKIIPHTQDYLYGKVKTMNVIHEPLITISHNKLSIWQKALKRVTDIIFSIIAIILLSPIYLFLIIGVKLTSKGPIFYKQERIGLHGKPFNIIKFRSMVVGAEKGTPQLSSKDDPRITPFGKMMRKTRLDEIPQFFNILKGDMSLVGPRPERQYYIDQIVEVAPYYKLLHTIKPGMTSWGQVKYGYAENVEQMVERLKWDILYLDNMSLQMDLKILIYTALIVFKGSGK